MNMPSIPYQRLLLIFLPVVLLTGCGSKTADFSSVSADMSSSFSSSKTITVGVPALTSPPSLESRYDDCNGEPTGVVATRPDGGEVVASAIRDQLVGTAGFRVIDISHMRSRADQFGRSLESMLYTADTATLRQILQVDALVFGDVTEYQAWTDACGRGSRAAFEASLVDLRNGAIHFTVRGDGRDSDMTPSELARLLVGEAFEKLGD